MQWTTGGWVLFTLIILLTLAQFVQAWAAGWLTPAQVKATHHVQEGFLPLIFHGGVWGAALLYSWLLADMVSRYGSDWGRTSYAFSFLVGFAIATLMCYSYAKSGVRETHVKEPTILFVLWWQMALIIGTITLVFLFTKHPRPIDLWRLTWWSTVYVAVGNHMLLGAIERTFGWPRWYTFTPLESPRGYETVVGTFILLGGATLWRVLL